MDVVVFGNRGRVCKIRGGELRDELATPAARIDAGTCRFLELVAELDDRGACEPASGSCAAWLAWRCGHLPRTARERVRVVWWEENGSLVLHGPLAPEGAALFVRALDATRESLWERRGDEDGGSAEPRPRPTNAEAIGDRR